MVRHSDHAVSSGIPQCTEDVVSKQVFVGAVCAASTLFIAGVSPCGAWSRPDPDSLIAARSAPEPRGALTLNQALALAAMHDPKLRGTAWSLRAAAARRSEAGRLSNPALGFEVENVAGGAGSDLYESTLTLGQTLELGGDRTARAGVAEAARLLALAELTSDHLAVLAEVSDRFLDTWQLQERVSRLATAERLAERFIEAAAERFRAGAGPALERTRAEAVLGLRKSERLRAVAEFSAGRQRLAASWGGTDATFDSLVLNPPAMQQLASSEDLLALLDAHPERQRARAVVALESSRLREARAARVPDLDVGVGVRRLSAENITTFLAGVSVPLPLWNSKRGSLEAAEAERHAAIARGEKADVELRARLHAARERYAAAAEAYALVASEVVPKHEDVLAQVVGGYRAGRFTSLEYVEAERSLLEARLHLVDATADAWRARLELERLLGRPIEEIGKDGGR